MHDFKLDKSYALDELNVTIDTKTEQLVFEPHSSEIAVGGNVITIKTIAQGSIIQKLSHSARYSTITVTIVSHRDNWTHYAYKGNIKTIEWDFDAQHGKSWMELTITAEEMQ